MESISKYTFHGIDYIKLDELNALLVQMKRDAREGTKPGYICEDEGKRIAAHGALNHLHAVLNKEKNEVKIHERVEQIRKAREAREQARDETEDETGEYRVYRDYGHRDIWFFRMWDNKRPVVGKGDGMIFTYKGMAEHVAELLGDGWKVIDGGPKGQEEYRQNKRLLNAIFSHIDDEPEYRGDGTRAEDEDWDGDDD